MCFICLNACCFIIQSGCYISAKFVNRKSGVTVEHDGVCKGCTLGKNAKESFSSSDNRSKGILDIIHSDVCGQMTVPSR
jgi:hypothetical protein